MGGSRSSAPPPPPPPAPPPAAPRKPDVTEGSMVGRQRRDQSLRRQGRAATILTTGEGTGTPRTGSKALLGE